jgi:hypothetical protein
MRPQLYDMHPVCATTHDTHAQTPPLGAIATGIVARS